MKLRNPLEQVTAKFKKRDEPASDNVISKQEKPPYNIEIIRSHNRRRTISARLKGNTMLVCVPSSISDAELTKVVDKFKKRFDRRNIKKELNKTEDLHKITERLNREYFNGRLKLESIEYSANQNRIFGCCNHRTRRIRISHRLARMPGWVRDYVIVHEMAHLLEPNHRNRFWDIVYRYKLAERARGYLIARELDSEEDPADIENVRD